MIPKPNKIAIKSIECIGKKIYVYFDLLDLNGDVIECLKDRHDDEKGMSVAFSLDDAETRN